MASLKELKGRINSVKSTQKITKAKQMVAAAKLRKAQAAAESARPYASRLAEVMGSLAGKITVSDNSPKLLAGTGSDQVHLLVVANSDKGLCGAFNANIVKAARVKAQELEAQGKTVLFYLVGRKGRAVIKREYPKQIAKMFDTTDVRDPGFNEAEKVANELVAMYEDGQFDIAHLFYSKFRSALVQEPTSQQIIPVPAPKAAVAESDAVVEYEPDEEDILAALLPRYLRTQIFGALLENAASEQGASMTAMDNATRNAGDLINKLTIQYNRSRQAAITTELVEIIAGAEAL
ncbi:MULTISPECIES: F0F1 ATP synthase subunit gamma [Novosphingobium]|uniref:ATP synthase gamma chain n=1 Tax=Novosphingobium pentaromativorans US6-1 TaxID=1088721 RepID=G6EIG7_9SPHN|nr:MULTISPECIES: F0F1 ATP synthase subunit gamma [Novosphingobium]AIT78788.1 ATP synthase F0F1 subunit gamma [Novosphingobium pentaromativorans US6-1]EHJ58909.1 F-type H+-transporting ATPase subunit gamma [Novosphingobium pentaromativorans US6-1]GFM30842.1 F-type H+-transporting ATPase subunit gamma [Novosphingobium sp. PY1]CCA93563.1 F-type H+-transporting ATPase subunit gamma [Novosphingobium sp. PP1Y]